MTQEELDNYRFYQSEIERLNEQIQIDGKRVAERIALIQAADGTSHKGYWYAGGSEHGDDAHYAKSFHVEGSWCYWEGCSASYDDGEIIECGKFEAIRLTMTDEQLDRWAEFCIEEFEKQKQLAEKQRKAETEVEKQRKAQMTREKELALLKELQEKYPEECLQNLKHICNGDAE